MRLQVVALTILLAGAPVVFAAPPSLGTDVKVSPRSNGYLFEIEITDLSTNKVLASPQIVVQANQPSELTTERLGGAIKTSVETDGVSAQVTVKFVQKGVVRSSSRLRLAVHPD